MIHVFCNLEQEGDGRQPLCDMTFDIAERRFAPETGVWRIIAQADADSIGIVGFGAEVPTTSWRAQVDDADGVPFHSFWGNVKLFSIGDKSDRLLGLLAAHYGIPIDEEAAFVPEVDCLTVGIESNPELIGTEPASMKLFFDSGAEESAYAELFLNVDLDREFVWLNEKDEAYRADLVKWLGSAGKVAANPYRVN